MNDDFDAKCELEHAISDKIIEILGLSPLRYSYKKPKKGEVDDCYPDHRRYYFHHMSICISEFLEGLTPQSNLNEALEKVAIEGPCDFEWDIGYWTQRGNKKIMLESPTWAELFKVANKAYIDGGCPDHSFLEGFGKDTGKDVYRFHFGS